MKKLILIIAILVSNISFGAGTPTSGNPTLNEEISNKLILDLSMVELNKNHQDFVNVSFYICNDEIEIKEITGSQKQLVELVKNKLSQLKIDQTYDEGSLYRYKFTFEKV
jgi:hypothetical protein